MTVHCSAACIVSLIGFYVRINLCKSLELDRLRANLPSNIGRVSAQNVYTPNKLHKERLISFVCLFFCPVNLCLNSKRLICGVDGLHGGFSAAQMLGLSVQAGIRNCVPSPSGLLRSVFSEKDVCFHTPGFDHQGSIAALASRISI